MSRPLPRSHLQKAEIAEEWGGGDITKIATDKRGHRTTNTTHSRGREAGHRGREAKAPPPFPRPRKRLAPPVQANEFFTC